MSTEATTIIASFRPKANSEQRLAAREVVSYSYGIVQITQFMVHLDCQNEDAIPID